MNNHLSPSLIRVAVATTAMMFEWPLLMDVPMNSHIWLYHCHLQHFQLRDWMEHHFHHLHRRRNVRLCLLAAVDERCWRMTWARVFLNPLESLCSWHFPPYLIRSTLGCLGWESFYTFPIRWWSEQECLLLPLLGDWLSGIKKRRKKTNGYIKPTMGWVLKAKSVH